jgi:hypothetical protein
MGKASIQRISQLDIHHASFQDMNGNEPGLELQGGRVVFVWEATEDFYRLSSLYNDNSPVNVLDFVNALRRLRAKMLSLKDNDKVNRGVRNGYHSR